MSELREAAQAAPDAEVRAQHKEFARWFLELSDKSALASEYLAWLAWKAALAHPPRDEWREAVHDELVTTWTFSAENKDDPRKALQDIINGHVRASLDPAVSVRYTPTKSPSHSTAHAPTVCAALRSSLMSSPPSAARSPQRRG